MDGRGLRALRHGLEAVLAIAVAGQILSWPGVGPLWSAAGGTDDRAPRAGSASDDSGPPGATRVAAVALVDRIVAARLFGVPATSAEPEAAVVSSAGLALYGILASSDPGLQFAILGSASASTQLYRAGDRLPTGARLIQVAPEHVLLELGGRVEKLEFPRSPLVGAAAGARTEGQAREPIERSMRGQAARVAAEVLQSVGMDVIRGEDGRVSGLVGAGREPWRAAGLRSGDLVVAVDGVTVDRLLQTPLETSRLITAEHLTLSVRRDGRSIDVVVGAAPTPAERRRRERMRR